MAKFYFLILCLFSFGFLSAQEKLSKEEKERRERNIQAGNPFAKFGYKAKVATLSKGKYLEVHDLDSIVTIGTTRWHVDKNKIVGDIVIDSLNPDARPIGDVAGRWISPDPLSEEFPSWSPYNMSFNNPIKFVDPDGRAPLDHWKIDKNGNARLIDRNGAGIFVMKEGDKSYTQINKFNFSNNSKAFNQIVSDYGKQAGYNGNFLTFSFVKNKLNLEKSYNVSREVYDGYRDHSISPMAALPEIFPVKQHGIVTYLKDGIVSDNSVYESKFTLISAIVHENKHMSDNLLEYGPNNELDAIMSQTKHSSWQKINGTNFKRDVLNYAKSNYNILNNQIGWKNSENGKYWLSYYKKYFNFD